jgi:uncharacterized protein (TIGR02266 family)
VVITIELAFERSLSLHACENLSAGGAFFRHAIPYKVGTQVDVTFSLPGEQELIRCRGEVANVPQPQEFGMGVKFIGLSEDQRARIAAFAAKAAQREVES